MDAESIECGATRRLKDFETVTIDLISQPGDAVTCVGAHRNPAPNRARVESRHAGIISGWRILVFGSSAKSTAIE